MSINIKDAEEKLGKDKVEAIVEKDWKVAELPSEEQLAAEKSESPKARSNAKSRSNLIQYRKKNKKQKEKMIKNLQFVEKEEDASPAQFLGKYASIEAITQMMPALDVLSNRKEQELYYNYIRLVLDDFDVSDLTASDFDDIVTLALNQVIIYRLMAIGSKNPIRVLEAGPTIEKFRKASEKIKSSLASRRVDRIDVKNKPTFSIVDLASELDAQDQANFDARVKKLQSTRKGYVAPARNEEGFIVEDES